MKWLDPHDPELRKAWTALPDPVMEHNGEDWQYAGTVPNENGWLHLYLNAASTRSMAPERGTYL